MPSYYTQTNKNTYIHIHTFENYKHAILTDRFFSTKVQPNREPTQPHTHTHTQTIGKTDSRMREAQGISQSDETIENDATDRTVQKRKHTSGV